MGSRSDWWFSNSVLFGWKDQFGNDSPFRTVSRCGQLLVYLLDFGPSSFVFLSQPVRQVYLQTQRGLLALPASKQNVLRPRFPIRALMSMPKALRSLSLSRNGSSVGCLKCVQFHNWFRLYQLESIFQRSHPQAGHSYWQSVWVGKQHKMQCVK